ncbi:MAG: hypothetical protein OEM05_11820 [Myxococcales bacterium]|nr:hypothetical protein [Myxococcales bacterium]
MRRIGSNIRKQISDAKANRITKNIIRYSDDEQPRNDYPRCIVSPVRPSTCCSDENRAMVGNTRVVDGFKFCYKICQECGHAVRFYFPAIDSTSPAVKEYRQWKRYMVQ